MAEKLPIKLDVAEKEDSLCIACFNSMGFPQTLRNYLEGVDDPRAEAHILACEKCEEEGKPMATVRNLRSCDFRVEMHISE